VTAWAGWLGIAAGAFALTVAVTWPLARCFDSCLGVPPDTLLSVYFLNWVAHALTTPGVRLLDAPMFAPYVGTLALGEYIPAYAPLAVPAILLTGNPVVAHNIVLVCGYTFAALGATALAARLIGATAPALIAGLVFGYSPRLLDQAYNLQTLSIFWLPWLFLALESFLARPTWVTAGLVAGIALGLALSSMNIFVYAGVATAVFLGVAITWGRRPLGRAHVIRLMGVGVPAASLLAAYLAPYRAAAREWGLGRTLAEVERHSASLTEYIGVPREDLLRWLFGLGRVEAPDLPGILPGVTVAALAVVGIRTVLGTRDGVRRALLPYVAMGGAAAILAPGPTLYTPWGSVALPYRLLHEGVPGFAVTRTPARFLVLVELTLALLAAAGAVRLLHRLSRIRRRVVVAGLAALVLIEAARVPFPGAEPRLDPAALPDVYRWLAQQPPRTVALGVPMGDWANVAASAFHLRRTVNGWSSFWPPRYPDLVEAMEAFPDERTVALIHGVRPDVVLIDRQWLTPVRTAALAAPETGLCLERAFPTHLVYRLQGAAPPGVETLEATARVKPSDSGQPLQACVALRNPGPRFVPLYPLRRVRLQVASGGTVTSAGAWLPVDLAPGAGHMVCVGLGLGPGSPRISGEVDGAGQVHRFAVTPDGPPQPLVPSRSPGPPP